MLWYHAIDSPANNFCLDLILYMDIVNTIASSCTNLANQLSSTVDWFGKVCQHDTCRHLICLNCCWRSIYISIHIDNISYANQQTRFVKKISLLIVWFEVFGLTSWFVTGQQQQSCWSIRSSRRQRTANTCSRLWSPSDPVWRLEYRRWEQLQLRAAGG